MKEFKFLERWENPSNYVGPDFSEYFIFLAQNRDSDILTRSNFISGLEVLGGESETVNVVRQGHWAVGWVEFIFIHESDIKSLEKAENILDALDGYPVLNENHFSEMEHDEFYQYAESEKDSLCEFLSEVFSIPEGMQENLGEIAIELNMIAQHDSGGQSCFNYNIYNFMKTNDFDTQWLERYLNEMKENHLNYWTKNEAFNYLISVLGIE